MKYNLPNTSKELTVMIDGVAQATKTLREQIQVAAVAVLYHAGIPKKGKAPCGDWTKANDLVHAVGSGVRQAALIEFFMTYGGLKFSKGDVKFTGWSGAEHIQTNWDEAKDTMWWTLGQRDQHKDADASVNGVDIGESLKRLLNNCDKKGVKSSGVDDATFNALLKLMNREVVEVLEPTVEEEIAELMKVS